MKTTQEQFVSDLAMLLRDQPRGTAARLDEYVIAWLDAGHLVFAYLRDDDRRFVEEEFHLDDVVWDEWEAGFAAWLRDPAFEYREEIAGWLGDSPPR
ncbi:hypothetical protein [Paraburkholderia tropica]|uniref:hypothetical protein n=1 Tax=Paraburkholderia tropica TaxID=92647 RepID=UPI0007EDB3BA|nr:hypothetical protein [Paraburkholderia tropica]